MKLSPVELAEGDIRDGLWLKAITLSNGNELKAKSEYVKLRLASFKTEMTLAAARAVEEEREAVGKRTNEGRKRSCGSNFGTKRSSC